MYNVPLDVSVSETHKFRLIGSPCLFNPVTAVVCFIINKKFYLSQVKRNFFLLLLLPMICGSLVS